jgi:hypothetical protein
MAKIVYWTPDATDSSWPFSADRGYKTCRSNPLQSLVRSNAIGWSSAVQFPQKGLKSIRKAWAKRLGSPDAEYSGHQRPKCSDL